MTSRQFNQDTGGAKRAATDGPVYITDRGRPSHVLMTYQAYEQLLGVKPLTDLLGEPVGVEDIELTIPSSEDLAPPAALD